MNKTLFQIACVCALLVASFARADDLTEDLDSVYTQEESLKVKEPVGKAIEGTTDFKELADLATLAPFKDVAVIQKRYLPKTGRFEGFLAGTAVINDKFFNGYGGVVRLGYHFVERYGVEFNSIFLSSGRKDVTSGLESRGVTTRSLVRTNNYLGLDLKYTPIYGKMSWLNHSIVPFDLYFSLGGGTSGTSVGQAPTVHVGTGQIFAISKSMAFRWDFSWNFYSAQPDDPNEGKAIFDNLFLTAGVSFFFPEASYR